MRLIKEAGNSPSINPELNLDSLAKNVERFMMPISLVAKRGGSVKIEDFQKKHSTSAEISKTEALAIRDYASQFNYSEVLQFCSDISQLLFVMHDTVKFDLGAEPSERDTRTITTALTFLQVIETIRDSREMLREVIKSAEFNPTKPS